MIFGISTFSYLLPIVIGLGRYKALPSILKVIFAIVCVNGFMDSCTYILHNLGYNNSLYYSLYVMPYAVFWTYPIFMALRSSAFRKVIETSIVVALLLVVVLLSQCNLLDQFNGRSLAIVGTHLILINLLYLFNTAVYSDKLRFRDHPLFFISAIFLIYLAFNTVIFAFMERLSAQTLMHLWGFRYMSYIVMNIVITGVFIIYAKPVT